MAEEELHPTKLGTKEHWDGVYALELENFNEIGDEGEVWFGEESVEKMVEWCMENVPASKSASILEIGTGNGVLLTSLVDSGYNPKLIQGIDYSPDAVRLAEKVASTRGDSCSQITYSVCDFLSEDIPKLDQEHPPFDLILDKGTFDAIALAQKNSDGSIPSHIYPSRLASALSPGGYFLITSCNFTEEELMQRFTKAELDLKYHSRVQHQTYTFGGRSGSIVVTIAFQKHVSSKF